MNRSEREKLDRLIRRLSWLEQRITEAESVGKDLSYDRSERSALQWAIEIIAAHFEEPIEQPAPVTAKYNEQIRVALSPLDMLKPRIAASVAEIQAHCVEQLRKLDSAEPITMQVVNGDHLPQGSFTAIRRGRIGFQIGTIYDNGHIIVQATPAIFPPVAASK